MLDVGLWLLGERNFSINTTGIATFNWYGQVFLRPYATFPHPNIFAAYMLLSGMILVFISGIKTPWQKFYQLLVAGSVFISFSRASVAIYTLFALFLLRKTIINSYNAFFTFISFSVCQIWIQHLILIDYLLFDAKSWRKQPF